jgi:hypothetical protein
MHEYVLDVWEMVAGLQSSDPGYEPTQDKHTILRWDAATTKHFSDSEVDKRIRSDVDAWDKTELDEMLNWAGELIAEWNLE